MRLTERQRQIVRLVAAGSTNKQIARVLGMEATTVKSHLRLILRKLRVRNRTQLAVLWRQFEPDGPTWPGSEERQLAPAHESRDASA
ncbi:MAG: response regulator transcription factor [Rhodospirillaceae bacterium]|nr:response regulator transcription factor [Rhodospirillaceae bacterium]